MEFVLFRNLPDVVEATPKNLITSSLSGSLASEKIRSVYKWGVKLKRASYFLMILMDVSGIYTL